MAMHKHNFRVIQHPREFVKLSDVLFLDLLKKN